MTAYRDGRFVWSYVPVVAGLVMVDDMAWRRLNHIADLCHCLLGRLCHVKMTEVLEARLLYLFKITIPH